MKKKKPIIIDLFCGCGGFSLGAARAGFIVAGAVDNDPYALAAHRRNFPNSKHIDTDLSKTTGEELRQLLELGHARIEGVIGGPPCQGFSYMGRGDDTDPRNKLFVHFFRLVAELQPRFFLCENVPGLQRRSFEGVRSAAFSHVRKDCRILRPMKLKASNYGAPTTRTRVFFFGVSRNELLEIDESNFIPPADIQQIFVKEALKGLPRRIRPEWQTEEQGWRKIGVSFDGAFGKRLHGMMPAGIGDPIAVRRLKEEMRVSGCLGTQHTKAVVGRFKKVKPGCKDDISKSRRLDLEGFCPTIRAGTGSDRGSYQAVRPIHPTEDRAITPREAARLQGFPDWFQFDRTKWHSFRQIGSSVSPILAEIILSNIRAAFSDHLDKSRGVKE